MSVSLKQRVFVSPQVLCQEVNGETVLLDLGSEFYFGLDQTGTRVFQLLQSGLSLHELIEKMLEEFDVDRNTLELDVKALSDQLLSAGLISLEPQSAN